MKKLVLKPLAIILMAAPSMMNGQITIQNYDYTLPVSPDTAYLKIVAAGNSTITPGMNSTWDLSGVFGGADYDLTLDPMVGANFPNADGRIDQPAQLAPGLVLTDLYTYYTKDANAYSEVGFEIIGKKYGLGPATGDPTDTLITLDTAMHFNRPILQFPARVGDNWSGSATVWIPFTITIEAAAWYGDTISLRQDVTSNDTVVGWGNIILPSGANADVILVHSSIVRVDSAFFNNVPMDPLLAGQFGFTQNDTIRIERYSFYAKGLKAPIYEYFTADGQQSTPLYYRKNDIGVNENEASALVAYPNPAKNTLNILGAEDHIQLIDMNGRVVLEREVDATSLETQINIEHLSPGLYMVKVGDQTLKVTIQ